MPLYVADYLADTTRLTTVQHGAYLLLIMAYWRAGEALTDDDEDLSSITRLSLKDWQKIRAKIAAFFAVEDGRWSHGRIEAEIERATLNREQKSAAGRASAAQRKNQRLGNDRSTDVATEPSTDAQQNGNSSSSPSPSKKEPNGSSGVAPSARQPATHLPKDWKPDDRQREFAAKLGLNPGDIEREAAKFVGYWCDGKGSAKRRNDRGWRQSWQTWVGNAAKDLPAMPRPNGSGEGLPTPGSREWYAAHPEAKPSW